MSASYHRISHHSLEDVAHAHAPPPLQPLTAPTFTPHLPRPTHAHHHPFAFPSCLHPHPPSPTPLAPRPRTPPPTAPPPTRCTTRTTATSLYLLSFSHPSTVCFSTAAAFIWPARTCRYRLPLPSLLLLPFAAAFSLLDVFGSDVDEHAWVRRHLRCNHPSPAAPPFVTTFLHLPVTTTYTILPPFVSGGDCGDTLHLPPILPTAYPPSACPHHTTFRNPFHHQPIFSSPWLRRLARSLACYRASASQRA